MMSKSFLLTLIIFSVFLTESHCRVEIKLDNPNMKIIRIKSRDYLVISKNQFLPERSPNDENDKKLNTKFDQIAKNYYVAKIINHGTDRITLKWKIQALEKRKMNAIKLFSMSPFIYVTTGANCEGNFKANSFVVLDRKNTQFTFCSTSHLHQQCRPNVQHPRNVSKKPKFPPGDKWIKMKDLQFLVMEINAETNKSCAITQNRMNMGLANGFNSYINNCWNTHLPRLPSIKSQHVEYLDMSFTHHYPNTSKYDCRSQINIQLSFLFNGQMSGSVAAVQSYGASRLAFNNDSRSSVMCMDNFAADVAAYFNDIAIQDDKDTESNFNYYFFILLSFLSGAFVAMSAFNFDISPPRLRLRSRFRRVTQIHTVDLRTGRCIHYIRIHSPEYRKMTFFVNGGNGGTCINVNYYRT